MNEVINLIFFSLSQICPKSIFKGNNERKKHEYNKDALKKIGLVNSSVYILCMGTHTHTTT